MQTIDLKEAQMMNTSSAASCCHGASGSPSSGSRWSSYLPIWLRGSRGIMLGAVALGIGGAALGWPWLVALGIAPILLSLAPCAVMCALGLCMMGKGSNSTASQDATTKAANSKVAPALLSDESGPVLSLPSVPERQQALPF